MSDNKEIKLVETVNETFVELIEGDVIKQIIVKQLESTFTSLFKDSMREYSDFGKIIKAKINSVVHLAASNVELPEYTKFVSGVVLEQFDKVLQAQAKAQLTELIEKELGVLPSGTMSASQLFEKIQEAFLSEEFEDEREISVELERSDRDAIYIKVVDEENHEEIKLSLYNHSKDDKNHYYIGYIDAGSSWHGRNTKDSELAFNTHCMDSTQKFLFRLYCAQTNLDMSDVSDFEDFTVGGHDY